MKIFYLESRSPDDLKEKPVIPGIKVSERTEKNFEFNQRLYKLVGAQWNWNDKLVWPDKQWIDYAEATNLHTWTAAIENTLAGYYELQEQAGGDVEIAMFGLLPGYIGRGIGGYLLTRAIKSAWDLGASRVWVHTCTLDHPGALGNYQARGMRLYKTETF